MVKTHLVEQTKEFTMNYSKAAFSLKDAALASVDTRKVDSVLYHTLCRHKFQLGIRKFLWKLLLFYYN